MIEYLRISSETGPAFSISIFEAESFIRNLFEMGERPIVTLPRKFMAMVQRGLREHATWDPDVQCIAGTFGTAPYCPADDDRVLLILQGIRLSQIHPRATGPDRQFHGTVMIDGPISPDQFEIIELADFESQRSS